MTKGLAVAYEEPDAHKTKQEAFSGKCNMEKHGLNGFSSNSPLAFLFRGYSHSEMAEITGYSTRFLSKLASRGNPAWTHKRWWLIPFAAWLLDHKTQKKRGRKPAIDLEKHQQNKPNEIVNNVIQMITGED